MISARTKVAFIITMHNHPEVTAQALLELFRTSRELPSVEFIVVDDGSTDSTTIVHQTLARMRYYFGVRVKLIRHETPKGYGLANQAGECRGPSLAWPLHTPSKLNALAAASQAY